MVTKDKIYQMLVLVPSENSFLKGCENRDI